MQINENEIKEIIEEKIKNGVKKFGKDFKIQLLEIISLEKMLAPAPVQEEKTNLIPLTKWNEFHSFPSVKSLRMKIYYNQNNFVDEVVERDGKRILINEKKYFEWHKKYNLQNS